MDERDGGIPNASANIRSNAQGTASHGNQRPLATGTATTSKKAVEGVKGVARDVVPGHSTHHSVWEVAFAERNRAKHSDLSDELTFYVSFLSCSLDTLESIDPANVAHCGLYILYMKLIFETHREPMEQTYRALPSGEMRIEALGFRDCLIKKDFQ
jgi:hypothetical protein